MHPTTLLPQQAHCHYHKMWKEIYYATVNILQHLNGKMLFLNNKSNRTIITPDTKKTIPNLGIEYEGKTGNLIIEFIIDFPINLSEEQMNTISSVLQD